MRRASLLSQEVLQPLGPYLVKSRVLAALLHTCKDTRAFACSLVTRVSNFNCSASARGALQILSRLPNLQDASLYSSGVRHWCCCLHEPCHSSSLYVQDKLERLDGLNIDNLELVCGKWSLLGASVRRLVVNSASIAASQATLVDCSQRSSDLWVRRTLASGAGAACVTWSTVADTFPHKLGSITRLRVHIPVRESGGTKTALADLRLLCQRLSPGKAGKVCTGRFEVLQILLGCSQGSMQDSWEAACPPGTGTPTPFSQQELSCLCGAASWSAGIQMSCAL